MIPIDAVPQGRPRFYNGVATDPARSRHFKTDFATLVKVMKRGANILTGLLKVEIKVYRRKTKFKDGLTDNQFGDVDNLAKGILDACNGILWEDDRQITDLHITKNLSDEPRVELSVEMI